MHISEGYSRLVLETSPDGLDPWDRQVVAHAEHAEQIAAELLTAASDDFQEEWYLARHHPGKTLAEAQEAEARELAEREAQALAAAEKAGE